MRMVCRCPVHLDLSLEAARKSLVLLKNEGGLLPLRPGLKRVALLGPSAAKVRLGDYSGPGDGTAKTLCECLRELMPQTEIIYEMGVNIDGGDLEAMPEGWLRGPDGRPWAARRLLCRWRFFGFAGPCASGCVGEF